VSKDMGNRYPNFTQTVYGIIGRFLLKPEELTQTAGELVALYGEGCTVREAESFLRKRE
jgi:hypothetical protein